MLPVHFLFVGIRRYRGQAAEVVVFATIRDRFQVFGISPVGDTDTSDLALFCHIYCLLFLNNGIIGKLIPGDSATLFHKTDCVRRCGTTAGPLKSDTLTAENRHPCRYSDSWINWRGDRHDVSPHAVLLSP